MLKNSLASSVQNNILYSTLFLLIYTVLKLYILGIKLLIMFWRKIFFLAAGYVAGNVVNTLYNSKKKHAINLQKKEDMKLMV